MPPSTQLSGVMVPNPPGGTVDPLARLLGAKLGETLRLQFVIENRAGAGGSIGTALAAKAPADGYTFLFDFDQHGVNPAILPKPPYDTLKDFSPVMLVGHGRGGEQPRPAPAIHH